MCVYALNSRCGVSIQIHRVRDIFTRTLISVPLLKRLLVIQVGMHPPYETVV